MNPNRIVLEAFYQRRQRNQAAAAIYNTQQWTLPTSIAGRRRLLYT